MLTLSNPAFRASDTASRALDQHRECVPGISVPSCIERTARQNLADLLRVTYILAVFRW